jgi:hypothetical protein
MPLQDILTEQIIAFHAAIMDSCRRSLREEQTDRMVLGLRGNAVSMAKLQLAMAALAGNQARAPSPEQAPEPSLFELAVPEPPAMPPVPWAADPEDHVLAGDALSHFVSRRLGPGESAHEAWQQALRTGDDATQRYPTRASDRGRRDVNARPP